MLRAKVQAYRAGEAAERLYGVQKQAADRAVFKSVHKSIAAEKEAQKAAQELGRQKLNTVMAAARAAHVAEGDTTVSAAHRGGGEGVRGSLATVRPSERMRGDITTEAEIDLKTGLMDVRDFLDEASTELQLELSTMFDAMTQAGVDLQLSKRDVSESIIDADTNLQTELTNISEFYDDTARQAEINLKNNYPVLGIPPSTGEMLINAASRGLNSYRDLSDASKAQFKDIFDFSFNFGDDN